MFSKKIATTIPISIFLWRKCPQGPPGLIWPLALALSLARLAKLPVIECNWDQIMLAQHALITRDLAAAPLWTRRRSSVQWLALRQPPEIYRHNPTKAPQGISRDLVIEGFMCNDLLWQIFSISPVINIGGKHRYLNVV